MRPRAAGFTGRVTGHMSPEQFRRHGREVIDWIADYYERLESLPVLSQVAPGEVTEPACPPSRRRPARASTGCWPTWTG